MKKLSLIALACLPLTACATETAGPATSIAAPSKPHQADTLAKAIQSATLVTRAVDIYVNSPAATPDKLREIKRLSDAVHAALVSLEQDHAAGRSLVFAGFNASILAFNAYRGN